MKVSRNVKLAQSENESKSACSLIILDFKQEKVIANNQKIFHLNLKASTYCKKKILMKENLGWSN
jgi:hypothetical protein